jgi:hypothetical protein
VEVANPIPGKPSCASLAALTAMNSALNPTVSAMRADMASYTTGKLTKPGFFQQITKHGGFFHVVLFK